MRFQDFPRKNLNRITDEIVVEAFRNWITSGKPKNVPESATIPIPIE